MDCMVQIPDDIARQLCQKFGQDMPNNDELANALFRLAVRYHRWPDVVGDKHHAALAILRDQAQQRAVQIAKPGEGAWNINRTTEDLLEGVLRGTE